MSLRSKKILITRAFEQSSEFAVALEKLGALVECMPFTRIQFLEIDWPSLEQFDLVTLSSQNAAQAFVTAYGSDVSPRIACIGTKTASVVLRTQSSNKLIIPEDSHGDGFAKALKIEFPRLEGLRVFSPQAVEARGRHLELLEKAGAQVKRLAVYTIEKLGPKAIPSSDIDYVTFLSGRGLESFVENVNEGSEYLRQRKLAVIGPVTAARAKELGLRVDVVPNKASFESMIESMAQDALGEAT